MTEKIVQPAELATLAKEARKAVGKTRSEAAREFKVAKPTMFYAEEEPARGLHKLRQQIIERYADCEVIGPVYLVRKRR